MATRRLPRTKRVGARRRPRRPARARARGPLAWAGRVAARTFIILFLATVALVALYRYVAPPVTPLILIRALAAPTHPWPWAMRAGWTPLDRMSPHLVRAVVVAEDARFCRHRGFDWEAMKVAIRGGMRGGRVRGASTITMQTAKNVFLWPQRSLLRKGLEAYFTVLIELIWPKDRIMEVYLNVIEWGDGIYGAEGAARAYFAKSAGRLRPVESARLAAVLPNPRQWSPVSPGPHMREKSAVIMGRMRRVSLGRRSLCP